MSFTHTLTLGVATGTESLSKAITLTSGNEQNIDETVADSSTDLQINVAIDVSVVCVIYGHRPQFFTHCISGGHQLL